MLRQAQHAFIQAKHPEPVEGVEHYVEIEMSTLSRQEVQELLSAYALGALDADERAAVESGLSRYPDMRAELAHFSAVAHGLNASVPQRPPPAALRASVLTQAQAQPQGTRQSAAKPSWWQRFIDMLSNSSLTPKLAMAALLLSAAFVVVQVAVQLPRGLADAAAQRQVQRVLASSSQTLSMTGTAKAPAAAGTIHYAPGDTVAAMQVSDLPPLSNAQTYQLWLTNADGERWSGAMFNTPQTGGALVLVTCPEPMDSIVRFGVSVEPAGGSPAPTGPGMLRGTRA